VKRLKVFPANSYIYKQFKKNVPMLKKFKKLFLKDIWEMSMKTYSPGKSFLIRQAKIFTLALRGFYKDKVQMRASALTYYTMLSIVPIVAMAFGIAKGFGFEIWLQEKLLSSFSGQEVVLQWLLTFVERYLANVKGGVIAGIGLVMLLWSVMKLLGNIEGSFNEIWQIKKARQISRKLSDYISLVVIAPILLFVSSSVTVFLSQQIQNSKEVIPLMAYLGSVLSIVIAIIPYILIWLVFTLLYIIMPNTKVKFASALTGGIIAGTIFQVVQLLYIKLQGSASSYGAIYGSFAALPLFLIWLQTSWLILLLGAEVAFANQNVEHYQAESETMDISFHLKRTVALMVMKEIVTNFKKGNPPATVDELANTLDFPSRLVRDVIYELLETGLISETLTKNVKENAYQPAIDIQKITIAYIIELLDKLGRDSIRTDNHELNKMIKVVDSFMQEIRDSKNNLLIDEVGLKKS
jgi:membrane protein